MVKKEKEADDESDNEEMKGNKNEDSEEEAIWNVWMICLWMYVI